MIIFFSTIMFTFFLALGWILMYVAKLYLFLSIAFFLYLLLLKIVYREANCKALEWKDFIVTFVFTGGATFIMSFFDVELTLVSISYLYLISFLSILMFADSIRYKSLM